jgi:hypothetical protein
MLLTYRHIKQVCKEGMPDECAFLHRTEEGSEESVICARGSVFQEKILSLLRLSPKEGNCSGHPLYQVTRTTSTQEVA